MYRLSVSAQRDDGNGLDTTMTLPRYHSQRTNQRQSLLSKMQPNRAEHTSLEQDNLLHFAGLLAAY